MNRAPPLIDATRQGELFIDRGQVSLYHALDNIVYSVNPDPAKKTYIPEFTRVKPLDVWYHVNYDRPFLWEAELAIPHGRPHMQTVWARTSRTRDGLIRIETKSNHEGHYVVEADERQGLQIVNWHKTWRETWVKGRAEWRQTAGGAWYPARLEISSVGPVECQLPSEFLLLTEAFTEQPEIPADQFQWRAHVPQGTRYEIKAVGGKTLQEGVLGQPRRETAEDVLRSLGGAAREGFAQPPGQKQGK